MKKRKKKNLEQKALDRLGFKTVQKKMKKVVNHTIDDVMDKMMMERSKKISKILVKHSQVHGYDPYDSEYMKEHCERKSNHLTEIFTFDGKEILRVTFERDVKNGEVYLKYEYNYE